MTHFKTLSIPEYDNLTLLLAERTFIVRDMQNYKENCRNGLINDNLVVKIESERRYKFKLQEINSRIDNLTKEQQT